MAAALLAVEHFNNRDASIFKELDGMKDCPVKLEPHFFDSHAVGHYAAQSFAAQDSIPCAIAGPFSDQPALELSTLATAYQFPLVAYRAFNDRVSSNAINPYTSQVFPDLEAYSESLLSYLGSANRSNYISMLYPATDGGTQRREALAFLLDQNKTRWFAEPYQIGHDYAFNVLYETMKNALGKIKEKGYRTIVVSLDDPVVRQVRPLSQAAEELGMLDGDYFWIWFGTIDLFENIPGNYLTNKMLRGSVWVAGGENYFLDPENDPFYNTWLQQPAEFVDRVNQANPIPEGEPGYVFAETDYFSKVFPDWYVASSSRESQVAVLLFPFPLSTHSCCFFSVPSKGAVD